jgi:hypothetical protein
MSAYGVLYILRRNAGVRYHPWFGDERLSAHFDENASLDHGDPLWERIEWLASIVRA